MEHNIKKEITDEEVANIRQYFIKVLENNSISQDIEIDDNTIRDIVTNAYLESKRPEDKLIEEVEIQQPQYMINHLFREIMTDMISDIIKNINKNAKENNFIPNQIYANGLSIETSTLIPMDPIVAYEIDKLGLSDETKSEIGYNLSVKLEITPTDSFNKAMEESIRNR